MKKQISHIPEPWSYNPSSFKQRSTIAVIASVAFFISIYLGLYQWGFVTSVWDPIFGEESQRVLDSEVSHNLRKWFIIPDAILGALAYLGDIVFALGGSKRRWQFRPWIVIIFGIDVIPLGFVSGILVLMQAFVVGYWCFLCLVTALVSFTLIIIAFDEVYSTLLYLYRYWKRTKSLIKLWRVFWGYPSKEAWEVGHQMTKG